MMKTLLFSLLLIVTLPAIAQHNYRDSLLAYQANYKKELFDVIFGKGH